MFREKAENERQKGSQNESNIELWESRVQNFEFLGACLRGLIFDEFVNGNNRKKSKSREGDETRAIVRKGSATEAGSSKGFWSQQKSVRVCKKHFRRLAPQAGGRRIICFASCRRPQSSKTVAVVLGMLYRFRRRKGRFPIPKWSRKRTKNAKREGAKRVPK